jgi:hypothetical protein
MTFWIVHGLVVPAVIVAAAWAAVARLWTEHEAREIDRRRATEPRK